MLSEETLLKRTVALLKERGFELAFYAPPLAEMRYVSPQANMTAVYAFTTRHRGDLADPARPVKRVFVRVDDLSRTFRDLAEALAHESGHHANGDFRGERVWTLDEDPLDLTTITSVYVKLLPEFLEGLVADNTTGLKQKEREDNAAWYAL